MTGPLLILSALLLLVSQIWLVVLGYKRGGIVWAVVIAFFSLIAGLAFCIVKKEGWPAWGLNVLAWLGVMAVYRNWL
jgi:hypothetical protein